MSDGQVSRREFVGLTAAGLGAAALRGPDLDAAEVVDGPQSRPVGVRPRVVATNPMASPGRGFEDFKAEVERAADSGVTLMGVPVATTEPFEPAARNLLRLQEFVSRLEDRAAMAGTVEDLDAISHSDRTGIFATLGGMTMVVEDLEVISDFRKAGVGVFALSANWRNWNGDGCLEDTDVALTELGVMAVRAVERAGAVVDLSGAGRRSSLQAMEVAESPVVFSSSNASALHPHPRNLTDDQISACAATGGVVCVSAFPALLAGSEPTAAEVARHLEYIAERAGPEHVALGLDFDDRPRARFPSDPLPEPPYRYPPDLSDVSELDNLLAVLRERGYGKRNLEALTGGNLIRVLREAWPRTRG